APAGAPETPHASVSGPAGRATTSLTAAASPEPSARRTRTLTAPEHPAPGEIPAPPHDRGPSPFVATGLDHARGRPSAHQPRIAHEALCSACGRRRTTSVPLRKASGGQVMGSTARPLRWFSG